MKIPFKSDFRRAVEYCNRCYLDSIGEEYNREKKSSNKKLAKDSLIEIIGWVNDNEIKKIVEEALKKCGECHFENPEIFHYLEEREFNFS